MIDALWGFFRYSLLVRSSVLATCLLIGGVLLFRCVRTRETRFRSVLAVLGVSVCTCAYALTLAELVEIVHHVHFEKAFNPIARCAVVTTCLLAGGGVLFRRVWTKETRLRSALMRLGLSTASFVYAMAVAELLVYCFFAETHSAGLTLASQRWYEKHWHPINSPGYRDIEHTESDLSDAKLLCVVGASYVTGAGIAKVEDRFSNILQDRIGKGWVVANVAKGGWNTAEKHDSLMTYPHKPDMAVLTYTTNDIRGAAAAYGIAKPDVSLLLPKPPVLQSWIERSYLLNLVYARTYAWAQRETTNTIWDDYRRQCYSSEDVWNTHKNELLDIVHFCERERIEFFVLVIPNLCSIEASRPITSRVAGLFADHGVQVVDLTDILAGRDPADMVVNPSDAHANESLNREIAERLFEVIAPRATPEKRDQAVAGRGFATATGGAGSH